MSFHSHPIEACKRGAKRTNCEVSYSNMPTLTREMVDAAHVAEQRQRDANLAQFLEACASSFNLASVRDQILKAVKTAPVWGCRCEGRFTISIPHDQAYLTEKSVRDAITARMRVEFEGASLIHVMGDHHHPSTSFTVSVAYDILRSG
jgi:hypothetical protein